MISVDVNADSAKVALRTLSMASKNITRGATRAAILKAAFQVGASGFDQAARANASQPDPNNKRSDSGKIFHAFEWGTGGGDRRPGNKLYQMYREGTEAYPVITYSFIDSRRTVPRHTEIEQYNPENKHVFVKKAEVFEKGLENFTVRRKNVKRLAWWNHSEGGPAFAKERKINKLAGGKTEGAFAEFFMNWWSDFGGAQANVQELGEELGRSYTVRSARVTSSIERRRRAKAVSDAALTSEAKAKAKEVQRGIEADMTRHALKKAREMHG